MMEHREADSELDQKNKTGDSANSSAGPNLSMEERTEGKVVHFSAPALAFSPSNNTIYSSFSAPDDERDDIDAQKRADCSEEHRPQEQGTELWTGSLRFKEHHSVALEREESVNNEKKMEKTRDYSTAESEKKINDLSDKLFSAEVQIQKEKQLRRKVEKYEIKQRQEFDKKFKEEQQLRQQAEKDLAKVCKEMRKAEHKFAAVSQKLATTRSHEKQVQDLHEKVKDLECSLAEMQEQLLKERRENESSNSVIAMLRKTIEEKNRDALARARQHEKELKSKEEKLEEEIRANDIKSEDEILILRRRLKDMELQIEELKGKWKAGSSSLNEKTIESKYTAPIQRGTEIARKRTSQAQTNEHKASSLKQALQISHSLGNDVSSAYSGLISHNNHGAKHLYGHNSTVAIQEINSPGARQRHSSTIAIQEINPPGPRHTQYLNSFSTLQSKGKTSMPAKTGSDGKLVQRSVRGEKKELTPSLVSSTLPSSSLNFKTSSLRKALENEEGVRQMSTSISRPPISPPMTGPTRGSFSDSITRISSSPARKSSSLQRTLGGQQIKKPSTSNATGANLETDKLTVSTTSSLQKALGGKQLDSKNSFASTPSVSRSAICRSPSRVTSGSPEGVVSSAEPKAKGIQHKSLCNGLAVNPHAVAGLPSPVKVHSQIPPVEDDTARTASNTPTSSGYNNGSSLQRTLEDSTGPQTESRKRGDSFDTPIVVVEVGEAEGCPEVNAANRSKRSVPQSPKVPGIDLTYFRGLGPGATLQPSKEVQDKFVATIPLYIRHMYQTVGFCKDRKSKVHLPVLCLNPFDMPPGLERDAVMADRTSLVGAFYYGQTDLSLAYKAIKWFLLLPYETGIEKGFNNLPDLSTTNPEHKESIVKLHRGLEMISREAKKKADERTHPFRQFLIESKFVSNSIIDGTNRSIAVQTQGDPSKEVKQAVALEQTRSEAFSRLGIKPRADATEFLSQTSIGQEMNSTKKEGEGTTSLVAKMASEDTAELVDKRYATSPRPRQLDLSKKAGPKLSRNSPSAQDSPVSRANHGKSSTTAERSKTPASNKDGAPLAERLYEAVQQFSLVPSMSNLSNMLMGRKDSRVNGDDEKYRIPSYVVASAEESENVSEFEISSASSDDESIKLNQFISRSLGEDILKTAKSLKSTSEDIEEHDKYAVHAGNGDEWG